MPVKPKKTLKKKYAIDTTVEQFFLTGEAEPGTLGHKIKLSRFFSNNQIEQIWKDHAKRIKKRWRQAGHTEESWVETWLRWKRDSYQFYLDEKAKNKAVGQF